MVSWYNRKKKEWIQSYKSIKCLTKEKKEKRGKRQMCARTLMYACTRAHTHSHIHTFNDGDWSWEDPKAQNLVSYCRPGLTVEKRTEGQECWTNSVLGWMSGCAYTVCTGLSACRLGYSWFHGGTLLLFLQRGGECTEMPHPSFLQRAGSTGNLNFPLAMAVREAWCFWLQL